MEGLGRSGEVEQRNFRRGWTLAPLVSTFASSPRCYGRTAIADDLPLSLGGVGRPLLVGVQFNFRDWSVL